MTAMIITLLYLFTPWKSFNVDYVDINIWIKILHESQKITFDCIRDTFSFQNATTISMMFQLKVLQFQVIKKWAQEIRLQKVLIWIFFILIVPDNTNAGLT